MFALQDRGVRFMVELVLDAPAAVRLLDRSITPLRTAARTFLQLARPVEHLDALSRGHLAAPADASRAPARPAAV